MSDQCETRLSRIFCPISKNSACRLLPPEQHLCCCKDKVDFVWKPAAALQRTSRGRTETDWEVDRLRQQPTKRHCILLLEDHRLKSLKQLGKCDSTSTAKMPLSKMRCKIVWMWRRMQAKIKKHSSFFFDDSVHVFWTTAVNTFTFKMHRVKNKQNTDYWAKTRHYIYVSVH